MLNGSVKNMYLVVTQKKWHIDNFKKVKNKKFRLISNRKKIKYNYISKLKPKLIFFPHWSLKVPKKITEKFKCVCFHETNLPYGRGGTPIQNLIIRKKKNTIISAFIMNDKIDAGDIIKKKPLMLDGSAQEIYERSSKIIFSMIKDIIKMKKIVSYKQKGKITKFKRLANNSEINTKVDNLDSIYDHIRMLDAETYKNAFLIKDKISITFFNVKKIKNKLKSNVIIDIHDK